ncbi:Uncharacterised protein [Chryseobacterium gleum]|uniref:DUF4843 domain-containing protein n=2 Tax=Chryseobacterium gleum TaxID=250 RepID=A0A448B692_CHRGE|nr:DUF4843 domain-containing protein [Chryseobacterium gleum]EFK37880.1 hypothetical protein HMPREF0204_10653 [Chryseobacterium gleum ATCC 35910]QBJ87617.1 DUF4843 domain-containing protein [Chryseobacterium gleum]QQY32658.1 DUF4843 domain-containing protein [Chryseobacterium gleum]VEE10115.1 Uncharacterised protein [Chryseobacterium gleum]
MKILKYLSIPIFALIISACSERDDAVYDGDNFVSFGAESSEATVVKGTTSKEVAVVYTTLSEAKQNTEVKIAVDAANSTAVEGVDFKILNKTDNLAAGQKVGNFKIQLLESGAKETQKTITFKISSPSVANATFNQTHTLKYSLECPFNMSGFTGTYKVVTDTWEDYSPGALITIQPGPAANQFKILSTNNPYISNPNTSYMLVTVQTNGNITVASNEAFSYGGTTGNMNVSGTGSVNFCTNGINISALTFSGAAGTSSGNKFVLVKN